MSAAALPVAPRLNAWYGYRRDARDMRDRLFDACAVARLPVVVDLRQNCPAPLDQGEIGSCTAHGITAALRFALMREGQRDRPLSRLQLYYDERAIEGTVESDAGAEIRDGIKSAGALGVAAEPLWPYNEDRFRQKPSANVYAGAHKFRALVYERVGTPDGTATAAEIKAAIASGFPVVGGFNVFAQFEGAQCARDGIVLMPAAGEKPIGGHCTYFPAYGQREGCITGRNSWNNDWGAGGDFFVPEAFLEAQGSDFWIIKSVGLQ